MIVDEIAVDTGDGVANMFAKNSILRMSLALQVGALTDLPHKLASLSHLLRTIRLRGVRRPLTTTTIIADNQQSQGVS
ncbi:hypothetical protein VTN02DRAFT_3275 [Thermoascus thermophilus]